MIRCGYYKGSSYLFLVPEKPGIDPYRIECFSLYVSPQYISNIDTGRLIHTVVPKNISRAYWRSCFDSKEDSDKYEIISKGDWSIVTLRPDYCKWRPVLYRDIGLATGRSIQHISEENSNHRFVEDFSKKPDCLRDMVHSGFISWMLPVWDVAGRERPIYMLNKRRAKSEISLADSGIEKGRVIYWVLEKSRQFKSSKNSKSIKPNSVDEYGIDLLEPTVSKSSYEDHIGQSFSADGLNWTIHNSYEPENDYSCPIYEVRSESGFVSFILEVDVDSATDKDLYWSRFYKNEFLESLLGEVDGSRRYISVKVYDKGSKYVSRYKRLDKGVWSLQRNFGWSEWKTKKSEKQKSKTTSKASTIKSIDKKIKKSNIDKLKKLN